MKSEQKQACVLPAKAGAQTSEDALKRVVKRIRRSKEFPTISQYITEINQKLSSVSVHTAASELANVILKDYALTNKLLKLVNSAFYGVMSGKVTTITRAVILLGYDNVRLASVSLVIFEHFKSRSALADLKDAVICSFWCGVIAKEIARSEETVDPEEAFICALLHQLGRLLTIFHTPDDYREIKYRIVEKGESERKAVKGVLGVSYSVLGMAVAKLWNFPEGIRKSMAYTPKETLCLQSKDFDPLCALASFSNQLGQLIDTGNWYRKDEALGRLLDDYSKCVLISKRQLKTLMQNSLESVDKHADALQFSIEDSGFMQRLTHFCLGRNNLPKGCKTKDSDRTDGQSVQSFRFAEVNGGHPGPLRNKVIDPSSIILEGLQEVTRSMVADSDMNNVALMSLEIIYRALKFNRVLMFVAESNQQTMEARFGYGKNVLHIVKQVQFEILSDGKDVFNQALNTSQDLIVEDSHATTLHRLIPDWYRRHIDAPAFIFLPVLFHKTCLGAFYADRAQAGPPISDLELRHVNMLRNQLILAIKFRS